jgi:hypothetical protein
MCNCNSSHTRTQEDLVKNQNDVDHYLDDESVTQSSVVSKSDMLKNNVLQNTLIDSFVSSVNHFNREIENAALAVSNAIKTADDLTQVQEDDHELELDNEQGIRDANQISNSRDTQGINKTDRLVKAALAKGVRIDKSKAARLLRREKALSAIGTLGKKVEM